MDAMTTDIVSNCRRNRGMGRAANHVDPQHEHVAADHVDPRHEHAGTNIYTYLCGYLNILCKNNQPRHLAFRVVDASNQVSSIPNNNNPPRHLAFRGVDTSNQVPNNPNPKNSKQAPMGMVYPPPPTPGSLCH